MPVLTGIDVLGVQRFVFSSNRLRDVVAGSYLVHWSTSSENGALTGLAPKEYILLAAGGNAFIEFCSIDEARYFAARYTRRLHNEVPGLEVVLVHEEFIPGKLARALQNIQIKLAKAKTERIPSVPLLGHSVTASCVETGMPATSIEQSYETSSPVPVSRSIVSRRSRKDIANKYWKVFLKEWIGFDFPLELDQLGGTIGDTNLIGVVHVDGNGVGKRIQAWLEKKVDAGVDDDVVRKEYREWSIAIDNLGNDALKAVVNRLCSSVDKGTGRVSGKPEKLGFEAKEMNTGRWLPLRPVLLGGDDLTFICDGRIALDLAEASLEVFENKSVPHLDQITASAGIAIVRAHSPFARAYELAEKLCRSAKGKLKETGHSGCAVDWHIGIARPAQSPSEIRKRQYQTGSHGCNHLTCRPYLLGSGKDEEETWRWLSQKLLDDDQCGFRGKVWTVQRNKVKALADLVWEGPDRVKAAIRSWSIVNTESENAAIRRLPMLEEHGGFFDGSRTPLLDAVELVDLHLVLTGADREQTVNEGEAQ